MFPHRRTHYTATAQAVSFMLALDAMLVACSPNSSQIAASPGPAGDSDPAPKAASLNSSPPDNGAGIWLGKLSRQGVIVNTVSCLITDAGEIACVLYEPVPSVTPKADENGDPYGVPPTATGGAHGTVHFTDTPNPSGSGTLYAAPGSFLSDGSSTAAPFTIADVDLTGIPGTEVNPTQKRLDLTISSLGEVSMLEAYFDHYYYRERHGDFSTDWIEGVYATFSIFDDHASLSIDADGSLYSQTASGCVLSGHIGIIDWHYNGYAASLTMENCRGLSGAYTGLAFLNDFLYVNGTDNLLVAVFNDTTFIAGEARKYTRVLP